jgi:hypothetical protein
MKLLATPIVADIFLVTQTNFIDRKIAVCQPLTL